MLNTSLEWLLKIVKITSTIAPIYCVFKMKTYSTSGDIANTLFYGFMLILLHQEEIYRRKDED